MKVHPMIHLVHSIIFVILVSLFLWNNNFLPFEFAIALISGTMGGLFYINKSTNLNENYRNVIKMIPFLISGMIITSHVPKQMPIHLIIIFICGSFGHMLPWINSFVHNKENNNLESIKNMPKLIGITGRKFNGKDTLGKFLIDTYGYKRFAFADPLKEACRCIFGFDDEQLYGNSKEIEDSYWHCTPRKVLQFVGTELFRNNMGQIVPDLGEKIWVEVVKRMILKEWEKDPNKLIVITDLRFANEVEVIRNMGGMILRVKRDSVNTSVDVHASELEIEQLNVDHEIPNNGTKKELFEKSMDHITSSKYKPRELVDKGC